MRNGWCLALLLAFKGVKCYGSTIGSKPISLGSTPSTPANVGAEGCGTFPAKEGYEVRLLTSTPCGLGQPLPLDGDAAKTDLGSDEGGPSAWL